MNTLAKAFGVAGLVLSSFFAPKVQAQENDNFEISPLNYFEAGLAYEKSFLGANKRLSSKRYNARAAALDCFLFLCKKKGR